MSNNFVKYQDLLTIKTCNPRTTKEPFALLPLEDRLLFGRYKPGIDMLEYGPQIPVRRTVHTKLIDTAKNLQIINPSYKLMVVYGFRTMEKQNKYFNEILEKVKANFQDQTDLYEYIHEKIAVPDVAGHPTGGAVDITIYDETNKRPLDFGTEVLDYSSNRCYFEYPDVSPIAKVNRKLLRRIMLDAGFAPYDGEWWHFSYGDKEWAFYYQKSQALYGQVQDYKELNSIQA